MLHNFQLLGCLMILKLHFPCWHISYIPEDLEAVSFSGFTNGYIDGTYKGKWSITMKADYC